MLSAHAHAAGVFRYPVEKRRHPRAVLDPGLLSTSTFHSLSPEKIDATIFNLHTAVGFKLMELSKEVEAVVTSGASQMCFKVYQKQHYTFYQSPFFFWKGMWCVRVCVQARERERERERDDE